VQGEIVVFWRTFMQQVGWCSSHLLDVVLTSLKERVAAREDFNHTNTSRPAKRAERIQALNSGDSIVSLLQHVDQPSSKRGRTSDIFQLYSLPGGKTSWDEWDRTSVSKQTLELFKAGNHTQMYQKCTVCKKFVLDAEEHFKEQHALQEAPRDMHTEDVGATAGMEMSEDECHTPRRHSTIQLPTELPVVLSPLRSRLVQVGAGMPLTDVHLLAGCFRWKNGILFHF
jgi:hypothetical protein